MANKPTGRQKGRPLTKIAKPVNKIEEEIIIPDAPILGPDGIKLWNQIWTAGRTWLKENHDTEIITQACQIKDEIEILRRSLIIGEVEPTYVATNKQPTTHPYVNQIAAKRAMLLSILATLGLNPEARTNLGLTEAQSRNILEELKIKSEKRLQTIKEQKETNE